MERVNQNSFLILKLGFLAFLGFSSSLFGLFGFLYIDLIYNWRHLEQPIRHLIKLLLGTALSFILGLLPG